MGTMEATEMTEMGTMETTEMRATANHVHG